MIELTSTTTFTVDRPIEAASGSYTSALIVATVLSAAKIAAADLGIRLTGIARTATPGKFPYSKVKFEIGLDSALSFGDTPVTYSTAMTLGVGTGYALAELEWQLEGNRGDVYRGDFMHPAEKTNVVAATMYDQIAITFYGDQPTEGVGATPRRKKQLIVAFATGFSNGEGPDIVTDVLDAYSTQTSGIGV